MATLQNESGYKKRLARRHSGNPGPNQQWVPVGSPLAARAVGSDELREERRRATEAREQQRKELV